MCFQFLIAFMNKYDTITQNRYKLQNYRLPRIMPRLEMDIQIYIHISIYMYTHIYAHIIEKCVMNLVVFAILFIDKSYFANVRVYI